MSNEQEPLNGGADVSMEEGAPYVPSNDPELEARIEDLVFRAQQDMERALGEAVIADLVELI